MKDESDIIQKDIMKLVLSVPAEKLLLLIKKWEDELAKGSIKNN